MGSRCQAPCPIGDGVAGLLQCCLTFIDSFLFITEREMAPDFSPCKFFPMRFLWGVCPPHGMPAAPGLGLGALFWQGTGNLSACLRREKLRCKTLDGKFGSILSSATASCCALGHLTYPRALISPLKQQGHPVS